MSTTIYSKFFLKNKYTKYYFLIINNSKNRTKQYSEKHHIIPRSFGGTDDSENLVDLTPREHFICHMLLTKMVEKDSPEWHKMVKAVTMFKMSPSDKYDRYINSRLYETIRQDFMISMSVAQSGEKNSQYGTQWINNPITKEDKKISKTESIPDGWLPGRFSHYKDRIKTERENKKKELLKDRLEIAEVYYKKYINGMSTREISKEVGINHVTIYNLINLYKKEKGIK